jgi:hypothetical protein
MTHQLDDVLKRLVNDSRADAALVWCRSGPDGVAVGLGGSPMAVTPSALLCLVPTGVADDSVGTSSSEAELVPEALVQALPARPGGSRRYPRSVAAGPA